MEIKRSTAATHGTLVGKTEDRVLVLTDYSSVFEREDLGVVPNQRHAMTLRLVFTEADRGRIKNALFACAGAANIHDLRTRNVATVRSWSTSRGGWRAEHQQGDEVANVTEARVATLLPGPVEVTARLKLEGIEDARLDRSAP